ncbi:MAG: transposase [Candidatus Gracilibacteria bacterium]|nr:transposase [Candidatus Gracilibacteria bacterium]
MSEISKLNQRIRNLEVTYNNQKNRALKFEKLYKEEKQSNLEKNEIIKKLKQEVETNKHTIEEYQRMIFHKKSKILDNNTEHKSIFNEAKNIKRTNESYKKAIPKKEEISLSFEYNISKCPDCGNILTNKKQYKKYIEDIDSSFASQKANKTIIEEIIESGYCNKCMKYKSTQSIPKSPIIFGENIRMFINFQSTILRISYSMIQNFFKIVHSIEISEGEIRNILAKEAEIIRPEYERIRKVITSQKGVHFDETGWLVQQEEDGNYAWCMTGTETEDVLYDIGISRGGGAVKMLAQNIKENEDDRKDRKTEEKIVEFVGISDGYGGYTNKFENHQLCWAHPDRKLRELSESKSLDKEKLERCKITSNEFSKLYKAVRDEIKKEDLLVKNNNPSPDEQRMELKNRLMKKFEKIVTINKNDPKKLVTYKNTLSKYREKYFVCILMTGIPSDNNKAERNLRHLVLKRKLCNGSITKKSASYMSINYSVLLSLYWKNPAQFFSRYKLIRDQFLKNRN